MKIRDVARGEKREALAWSKERPSAGSVEQSRGPVPLELTHDRVKDDLGSVLEGLDTEVSDIGLLRDERSDVGLESTNRRREESASVLLLLREKVSHPPVPTPITMMAITKQAREPLGLAMTEGMAEAVRRMWPTMATTTAQQMVLYLPQ